MNTQIYQDNFSNKQLIASLSKSGTGSLAKSVGAPENAQSHADMVPSSFRDILGKAGQKRDVKLSSGDSSKTAAASDKAEGREQMVCFRNTCSSRVKLKGNTGTSLKEGSIKEESSMPGDQMLDCTQITAASECLAQVLGMTPNELNKLLDSFNMDAGQISKDNFAAELSDKLGALLGLDDTRCRVLEKAIETLTLQMKAADPVIKSSTSNTKQEISVQDFIIADVHPDQSSPIEITNQNSMAETSTDKLAEKVLSAIDKLVNEASKGQGMLEQYVTQAAVQAMSHDIRLKVNGDTVLENKISETGDAKAEEAAVAEADIQPLSQVAEAEAGAGKEGGISFLDSKGKEQEAVHNEDNVNKGNALKFGQVLSEQVNKPQENMEMQRAQSPLPVSRDELLNQIVEKAKVVVDGQKSEMLMDLKPDNLGKLSLKVVTERGLVVAKFIAENEQVKAVLETNMQLLKDSLEKQGLTVNALGVSVQQDSRQGAQSFYGSSGKEGRVKSSRLQTAVKESPVSMAIGHSTYTYGRGNSTIDLIA